MPWLAWKLNLYSTFVAKAVFFTRKNLSNEPRISFKFKMCDKLFFKIYIKMSFITFVDTNILSFKAQVSHFLRHTLKSGLNFSGEFMGFMSIWKYQSVTLVLPGTQDKTCNKISSSFTFQLIEKSCTQRFPFFFTSQKFSVKIKLINSKAKFIETSLRLP